VQRVVAARPELDGQTIALYSHDARGKQTVAACSDAAFDGGIRIGMPLAEATALFSASPLFSQEHDPAADREALEQLAEACEQFSPLVGLESVEQPTDLLLDVTGLGPLFGGDEALAYRVVQSFHRRRYTARVAVADTIGIAWAAAHFGFRMLDVGLGMESRQRQHYLHQELKSKIQNPKSKIIFPPGKTSTAIRDLPIEALRLPVETVALLAELGIDRIEQLLALPRESLSSRFGDVLARRLDQAEGTAEEVIVAYRPPVDFQAQWSLEHPTSKRAVIGQVVSHLVEQVAGSLHQRDRGAVQLECSLDCGDQSARVEIGLFQPTATAQHLAELVHMQLERLTLPEPVAGVCVRATTTAPLVYRQSELFTDQARRRPRQLAALVDRLSARLGRKCVVGPRRQPNAQPERAFRYVPLAGNRPRRTRQKNRPANREAPGPTGRPLHLASPPPPLDVISIVPDGPPIRFRWQTRQHRVARHWGPERIETTWWRSRSIRRDYYRVETDNGQRFWLFRRLTDGKWFLHGEFE